MTFSHPSIVPIALILTLGAVLAGCSGAPRMDTARAATATSDTTDSICGTKVRCSPLTKAQVQPLMANTITDVKVTAAGTDAEGQQCVFSAPDGTGAIDVLVLAGADAQQAYAGAIKAETHGPVAVPGVGDKASRDRTLCNRIYGSGNTTPDLSTLTGASRIHSQVSNKSERDAKV